jgi:hypothetical protein
LYYVNISQEEPVLEQVDIQEVLRKVEEGKLEVVKTVPLKISILESNVRKLENYHGCVDTFTLQELFTIETALQRPENKELKHRWDATIRLSTKIRMNVLRCKALDMLELYQNKSSTSSAPDIAYCKTLLSGFLTEEISAARAKYYNKGDNTGGFDQDDRDEMINLSEQL